RPPPPAAAAAGARCSPAAPAPVAAPPPRTSSSCSPLGSTLTAYRQSIPRNPGNGSRIPGFLRFFNPVSPPGRGSARPRPGPPSTLSWAGRSPVAVAGLPGAGVAVADAGAGDLGEASALRDGGAPVAGPVVARRAVLDPLPQRAAELADLLVQLLDLAGAHVVQQALEALVVLVHDRQQRFGLHVRRLGPGHRRHPFVHWGYRAPTRHRSMAGPATRTVAISPLSHRSIRSETAGAGVLTPGGW